MTLQKGATLREAVYSFAKEHFGKPSIGKECTGLAEAALKTVGAKTVYDYQSVTGKKDQDYKWGEEKDKFEAGQILQFRDHQSVRITRTDVKMSFADGSEVTFWIEDHDTKTRGPQHTAIMASDEGNGVIYVYEQHVNIAGQEKQKDKVQMNIVYTENRQQEPTTRTYSMDLHDPTAKSQFIKTYKLNEKRYAQTYSKLAPLLSGKEKVTVTETIKKTITVRGKIWAYEPQPQ